MADILRTGSLGLDILLKGGWKPGTINEIWGEPGSGKTTLAEHALWELQAGRNALWISMGTEIPHRPSGAHVAQPRNAEHAFYIMETCVLGSVSLIVVDSANGLVRQRELDADPEYVPHPQREYKEELNGLKECLRAHGAIVIFLSKPRDRDRQPVRGTGISEKARDRVQLKIAHTHQDEVRDVELIVNGVDASTGFRIVPGSGIDWADELAHLSIRYGFAKRQGSWIDYNAGVRQGIGAFAAEVRDNVKLAVELDDLIRAKAGI